VKYLSLLPELLSSKQVKADRIKSMEGGLDGILEGFEMHSAGKVSAEKLCYQVGP